MTIPPPLLDLISNQRVILLLGAGASVEAEDKAGNKTPSTGKLTELIADKFLAGAFRNSDLSTVSDYAASEQNILAVQHFIRETLLPFQPTPAHLLLPKFNWAGLATTNYDLLVEKAYENTPDALQKPVPFIQNGDQIIESLKNPSSVKYLKLHGCITRVHDEMCPLILTRDHYNKYRDGRSRIFDQLHEWAYEHTIIFVGHSGEDPDIREVIFDLEKTLQARPRYYLIKPNPDPIAEKYWGMSKVSILGGTFGEFMTELNSKLAQPLRALTTPPQQNRISRRFRVAGAILSQNCSNFLQADSTYVDASIPTERINPIDFYRGHDSEWSAIEQKLDVPRKFVDDILEDVFLVEDLQARKPLEVILISGYAGSGKTVSLKRLAWTSAIEYDCLCIYLNDDSRINATAIEEIITTCKERVFLFIDDATDHAKDIWELAKQLGNSVELLTIILAARRNEWNQVPGNIESLVTRRYEVQELDRKEIIALLDLLSNHAALGRLSGKPLEEQLQAFEGFADRQLLVALHEATLGQPFEVIIENEYKDIESDEARRVYLTICVLNRLGVPVRAGLISRVHGIVFSRFKEQLFQPLEHVVYTNYDSRMRDHVYRARHPIIAEIIFDRILTDEAERFYEYTRCLSSLNVDYSTDFDAFRQLMRARTLLKLFSDQQYIQAIFEDARKLVGDEPNLLQQRAIFEMNRKGGNLVLASQLLTQAIELKPYNKQFKHTKAELALRKAENARTPLEKDKLLREAGILANQAKEQRYGDTHGHHTLAKVNLAKLEFEIRGGNTDFSSGRLQELVRNVESVVNEGLQLKPGDSYLLHEQAKLSEMMRDFPKAMETLEQAVAHNPKLSFLALQLAGCYIANDEVDKAGQVLAKAASLNRTDRTINYRYALHLERQGAGLEEIIYYLRRSFVPGDKNYDAQLRCYRALFLDGKYEESVAGFRQLRSNRDAPYEYGQRLYEAEGIYTGIVDQMYHSHFFLIEDVSKVSIFLPRSEMNRQFLRAVSKGSRVKFRLAFSFKGLVGFGGEVS